MKPKPKKSVELPKDPAIEAAVDHHVAELRKFFQHLLKREKFNSEPFSSLFDRAAVLVRR